MSLFGHKVGQKWDSDNFPIMLAEGGWAVAKAWWLEVEEAVHVRRRFVNSTFISDRIIYLLWRAT